MSVGGCGHCFICSTPTSISSRVEEVIPSKSTSDVNVEVESVNDPKLTSGGVGVVEVGAKVIFLLCKLLDLPSSRCEELLTQYGHPSTWIDICDLCSTLVTRARDLHLEIGRLQAEFSSIQVTLRGSLQVKREVQENGVPCQVQGSMSTASDKIRSFFLESVTSSPANVSSHFVAIDDIPGLIGELQSKGVLHGDPVTFVVPEVKKKCKRRKEKFAYPKKGRGRGAIFKRKKMAKAAAAAQAAAIANYLKTEVIPTHPLPKFEPEKKVTPKRRGRAREKKGEAKFNDVKFVPKLEPEDVEIGFLSNDALDQLQLGMGMENEDMGMVDIDNGIMGEEILPEAEPIDQEEREGVEEAEISISYPPPPEEGSDSNDPFTNDPISSGEEYCDSDVEVMRHQISKSRKRRTRKNASLLEEQDSDSVSDFLDEKSSSEEEESDDVSDEFNEPEPKRGPGRPKKTWIRGPYKKRDKTEKELKAPKKKKSKVKKAISHETRAPRLKKPMEEKVFDIEIPVQPSWIWEDFVKWRKSQVLILRQGYTGNTKVPPEIWEQIATTIPSLEWLAMKYKVDKFPCPGCDEVFPSFALLQKHAPKRCQGPYRCWFEGCAERYMVPDVLVDHVRSKHLPPEDSLCSGCGTSFLKQRHFNSHVNPSPPGKKGQPDEGQLQISSLCKEKAIQCPQCKVMRYTNYFMSQSVLDVHIRTKHPPLHERPFACTVSDCGKRFLLASDLNTHKKVVHEPPGPDREFICDQCGRSFKYRPLLTGHIQKVHLSRLPGAKRFACDICGKEMIDLSKLARHKQIHIRPEDAPHLCTICGKRFRLREYLNIHMRSHDPERHLKYPHYRPKNQRAPADPGKVGVSGAKIGRPPVQRSTAGSEGARDLGPVTTKRKLPAKRKKKMATDSLLEDFSESASSNSTSMEYTPNSVTAFNPGVVQVGMSPQFNFNQAPLSSIDQGSFLGLFGGQGQYQPQIGIPFQYPQLPPRFQ